MSNQNNKKMHLWGGDGDGNRFFWVDEDFEPKHRDYFHSGYCPCLNQGKDVIWEWKNQNYVPIGNK